MRRFRQIVDLHAEGKLNWTHAETVRSEVEQLFECYTDILVNMSDDEFPPMKHSVRIILVLLATAIWCVSAAVAEDVGDMVAIPGGPFVMGSDDGPADERPLHRITLAPFMIDRVAVSNRKFANFLNAQGWKDSQGRRYYDVDDGDARIHRRDGRFIPDPGYETHAAVEPSWRGARAYCRWRGKRLPTEAEWERAARGTNGRAYPWGEATPDAVRARFSAGWNATVPVTGPETGATPDGVVGLAGNTHEWTSSLYFDYPYRADDGREEPEADGERVTRGGAHDSAARHMRAVWRGNGVSRAPRAGHHNIGFRCARDAPQSHGRAVNRSPDYTRSASWAAPSVTSTSSGASWAGPDAAGLTPRN